MDGISVTLNIIKKYSFWRRINHTLKLNTLHRQTVSTSYIQQRLTNFAFVFQEAEGTWQYFMLKVTDLLDTVCIHLHCYGCSKS
jgi:hypothetical protein